MVAWSAASTIAPSTAVTVGSSPSGTTDGSKVTSTSTTAPGGGASPSPARMRTARMPAGTAPSRPERSRGATWRDVTTEPSRTGVEITRPATSAGERNAAGGRRRSKCRRTSRSERSTAVPSGKSRAATTTTTSRPASRARAWSRARSDDAECAATRAAMAAPTQRASARGECRKSMHPRYARRAPVSRRQLALFGARGAVRTPRAG